MKIEFQRKYKSIEPFVWDNIPDFAVITGVNGAGKSQFFDGIKRSVENEGGAPNIRITPRVDGEEFKFLGPNLFLAGNKEISIGNIEEASKEAVKNIILFKNSPQNPGLKGQISRLIRITEKIEEATGKDIRRLTEKEIMENLPGDFILNEASNFSEHLSAHFVHYMHSYMEAELKKLSKGKILEKIGIPPWEQLNEIFQEAGFTYRVNTPEKKIIQQFKLKLTDIENNSEILFSDLSSGEQIIASTAIWLFNSQLGVKLKLIILDEPDAHLHPSLTRKFLDVVINKIVAKYNIKVIMTTHSPSTVALTPLENLFIMHRGNKNPKIETAQNKESIISLLTSNLIVVNQNTKYVLVEDDDDVRFYTTLYKLSVELGHINSSIPLNFIPASTKSASGLLGNSGGNTVVNNWVNKLADSGLNNCIFGITDRDQNNEPSGNIFILKRYSIENYLVDPINIFTCLLDVKDPNIFEIAQKVEISFGDEHKLRCMESIKLQYIADEVIKILYASSFAKLDYEEIGYCNKASINIPKCFINERGKDLRDYIGSKIGHDKISIPKCLKVIEKNHLIPKDIIDIFEKIQTL